MSAPLRRSMIRIATVSVASTLGGVGAFAVLIGLGTPTAGAIDCPAGMSCTVQSGPGTVQTIGPAVTMSASTFTAAAPMPGASIIGPTPDLTATKRPSRAIGSIDWSRVTPADIASARGVLSEAELMSLAPSLLSKYSGAQIAAFGAEAIGMMSADQIAAIAPLAMARMSADQIAALAPAAMAKLSPDQVAGLKPAALRVLSPEQVDAMTPSAFKAVKPAQVRAIEPETVAAMDPPQLAALPPSTARALTKPQVAQLSKVQRKALRR